MRFADENALFRRANFPILRQNVPMIPILTGPLNVEAVNSLILQFFNLRAGSSRCSGVGP